jgi:hypothetical protein
MPQSSFVIINSAFNFIDRGKYPGSQFDNGLLTDLFIHYINLFKSLYRDFVF